MEPDFCCWLGIVWCLLRTDKEILRLHIQITLINRRKKLMLSNCCCCCYYIKIIHRLFKILHFNFSGIEFHSLMYNWFMGFQIEIWMQQTSSVEYEYFNWTTNQQIIHSKCNQYDGDFILSDIVCLCSIFSVMRAYVRARTDDDYDDGVCG